MSRGKLILIGLTLWLHAASVYAADAAAPGDSCSGFTVGSTQTIAGAIYKCTTTGGSDKWLPMALYYGATATGCSSTNQGQQRYNFTDNTLEYCNSAAWVALHGFKSGSTGTGASDNGYFVLTTTTWDGNLGGRVGADAKCLTELGTTYTTWMGYTDANSRGLLNAAHVYASICDAQVCNNLLPLTVYNFAVAGDAGAGGATFTTDSDGLGPNDSANWSDATYFNISTNWWSNRLNSTATLWALTPVGSTAPNHCTNWTINASGTAQRGATSNTTALRWNAGTSNCTGALPLVCMVNPNP